MKKIPSLFVCDYTKSKIAENKVTPGCEWVILGEGIATIKRDGMACMFDGKKWYARYDAKKGMNGKPDRKAPPNFIPCEETPDPISGHWPGWVEANRPCDKWINIVSECFKDIEPGTYEICGPKINTNHENLTSHTFFKHGSEQVIVERTYDGLKEYLSCRDIEGIVFHHPDGRMCKIRQDHFGLKRGK